MRGVGAGLGSCARTHLPEERRPQASPQPPLVEMMQLHTMHHAQHTCGSGAGG